MIRLGEARSDDYLEGEKWAKTHACALCGGELTVAWGGAFGYSEYVLRCGVDASHEGIVKRASKRKEDYQRMVNMGATPEDIEDTLHIEQEKKERMTEEHGEKVVTALDQYRGITSLSEKQATTVLTTIWRDAPPAEIKRAAMLCATYGLNPLNKHVYLIKYKGKERVTWATVMGIGATRLIASRRGPVNYVDGPRVMTEEEQRNTFGEVAKDELLVIVVVADENGNRAPGYGSWPRATAVKGADKGNSQFNMASIRAERKALERLRPGEMPQAVEVVDEAYMDDQGKPGDIEGDFTDLDEEKPGPEPPKKAAVKAPKQPPAMIQPEQLEQIYEAGKLCGYDGPAVDAFICKVCGVDEVLKATTRQAEGVLGQLQAQAKAA